MYKTPVTNQIILFNLPNESHALSISESVLENDPDQKVMQKLTSFLHLKYLELNLSRLSSQSIQIIEQLKTLKVFKELSLNFSDMNSGVQAINKLVESGVLKLESTEGRIGAWYETGKELGSQREFMPNDGISREISLKQGHFLKIYSAQGEILFSGYISGGRDQKEIDVMLWQGYFYQTLNATLTRFFSTTTFEIQITWNR